MKIASIKRLILKKSFRGNTNFAALSVFFAINGILDGTCLGRAAEIPASQRLSKDLTSLPPGSRNPSLTPPADGRVKLHTDEVLLG